MAFKTNTEHVVCFSFHRFGTRVNVADRSDHKIRLWYLHSDPKSSWCMDIQQVDNQLEAFRLNCHRQHPSGVSQVIRTAQIYTNLVALFDQKLD